MRSAPGRVPRTTERLRAGAPSILALAAALLPGAAVTSSLFALAPLARAAEGDPAPEAGLVAQAERLLADDDPARAVKELEAGLAAHPAAPALHLLLVRAHLAADDTAKAVAAAKRGMEACPTSADLLAAAAHAFLSDGDPGTARDLADKAAAAYGAAVPARVRRTAVECLVALESPAAGEALLRKEVTANPKNADMQFELGDFLLAAGRAADALDHLKYASESSKTVPAGRRLAEAYLALRKNTEARDVAKALVAAHPGDAGAHWILGRAVEALGERDAARTHFEQALKLRPRFLRYQIDLAFCLSALQRWKEAEPLLKKVVAAAPDNIEARLHLGWVYNASGRIKNAVEEYLAILKTQPRHAQALWYAADAQVVMGRAKDAEELLTRLLEVRPNHSEAYRLLGQIAYGNGKLDDARKHVARSLEIEPKNGRTLLLQGRIEDISDKVEEAEKSYLAAIEAAPRYPWPHLFLAELYDEVLDEPQKALDHFRKYLDLGGPDDDNEVRNKVKALEK